MINTCLDDKLSEGKDLIRVRQKKNGNMWMAVILYRIFGKPSLIG